MDKALKNEKMNIIKINTNTVYNMSLTLFNLVPQRPFCYLNFSSVAKPQKIGNETYDAHVLASSKTYRKQNKPKKWIPNG